jgi:acetyl-CoA carboxylase biotin carboxyl carrier protein
VLLHPLPAPAKQRQARKLLSYSIVTVDEIRELIQLAWETGVAELEVQRGENRVRIRRTFGEIVHEVTLPNQQPATTAAAATAPPVKAAPQPDSPAGKELVTVKAPIVGTFYESASPGSPPFVRVGETVQPGKVLCIIESMKLMNEIEAEIAGMIESKLVPNGQPVEYGEALFAIRPL